MINNSLDARGAVTAWVAGYTQANGQPEFLAINDPLSDVKTGTLLRGLIVQYGAVNIRTYTYELIIPVASNIAVPGSQLNDPSTWIPAP